MHQRFSSMNNPLTAAVLAGLAGCLFGLLGLDAFFWSDDFWLLRWVSTHGIFDWWYTTPMDFAAYWPRWPGLDPSGRFYLYMRPLTTLSLKLDYDMWGMWAPGYHITQTVLAGLSVSAFFAAARRFTSTRAAFAAALLFAVLPLQAEARCWIAARSGLLSSTLLFAAVATAGNGDLKPWLRSTLAVALLLAGLTAKADAVMAIPWMLALVALPPDPTRPSRRDILRTAGISLAIAATYLIAVKVVFAPPASLRMEQTYLHEGGVISYFANLSQYLLSLHTQVLPAIVHSTSLARSLAIVAAVSLLWGFVLYRSRLGLPGLALVALMLLPLIPASLTAPNERHMLLSGAALSLLLIMLMAPRWQRLRRGLRIAVLAACALLVTFSVSHHRSAASLGYATRDYAESILDACPLPAAGGRLYLTGVLPGMTQIYSALSILSGRQDFSVVILSLAFHNTPDNLDIPPEARFWQCLTSTYGCPPVTDEYSLTGTTLRQRRPHGWFFDSSTDRSNGLNMRYRDREGIIFKEPGHFTVRASDIRENGLPQTLEFTFEDTPAGLCLGQGAAFTPAVPKP